MNYCHYQAEILPDSKYRSSETLCANQEFKSTRISSLTEIDGDDINIKAKSDALWQPKKSLMSGAKLIMKVYEIDPLKCEQCGKTMKIIPYIANATSIHKIFTHIGDGIEHPKIHSARGPPDECCYEAGDHLYQINNMIKQ